jgi:polysaccharide deacetylase 2 family uncharacterized protein YibQ
MIDGLIRGRELVQSRIRKLRRKARREHARSRRLRARAIFGLAAAATLGLGALLLAGAILLPSQAPANLQTPEPKQRIAPRLAKPAPAERTAAAHPAYPPAPPRAPDYAAAILSALPPPAPEPPEALAAPTPRLQPTPPFPAPAQRVALLTPPPLALPPRAPGEPPWRRYAAPAPPADGRPQVAIVIDDVGLSHALAERTIALPRPITIAMLPYGHDLPGLAAKARKAGHELLVHLPMEPENGSTNDPGPNALLMSLGAAELDRRIAWNLQRFEGFVGVNNHMGSLFTASPRRMERLMAQLKSRGLLFLDSKTSEASVGYRLARSHGVPAAERDVFLDNERLPAAIRAQLAEVERIARRHGRAIAIGHPYPETLEALAAWLAAVEAKGFALAPVSALVARELSG